MAIIVQVSSGLIVADDFDRSDNNTVGNGWSELEDSASDLKIASNLLENGGNLGNAKRLYRVDPAASASIIVQANMRMNNTVISSITGVVARGNGSGGSDYQFKMDQFSSPAKWSLVAPNGGSLDSAVEANWALGEWWAQRLVIEDGASISLRGYAAELSGAEDQSVDLTVKVSGSEVSTGTHPDGHYGIILFRNQTYANLFFACGRNITVTGLPTGYKVQVDNRAAVAESGGSVTLNVDTWALPATTVKVLDASDDQVASVTPSAGVYGGDTYTFSEPASSFSRSIGAATLRVPEPTEVYNAENERQFRSILSSFTTRIRTAIAAAAQQATDDLTAQELNDHADVSITSVADGDLVQYDSASGLWKNHSIADSYCEAYLLSNQADFTTGNTIQVKFDATSVDDGGNFDTSSSNWSYTCPEDGVYQFVLTVKLDSTVGAGTIRRLEFWVNGTVVERVNGPAATVPYLQGVLVKRLSADDVVKFYLHQDSGGTRTAAGGQFNDRTHVVIQKIGFHG